MARRNLSQHVAADRLAMKMSIYRDQLQSVADEPGSDWMDQSCRRYSLRHLMRYTVANDRAHRKARGWP